MRFLVVDDEWLSAKALKKNLTTIYPEAEVISEEDYRGALTHVGQDFDAIFLDIEMPGMNGIQIAEVFLKANPKANIIFVTAYDDYAREAFNLHASGYVSKPYYMEQIKNELECLRYSGKKEQKAKNTQKLKARCFGNFEIFKGKEPLHFERRNSKEILAYLIHLRGALATRQEICTILWEDSVEVERRKGYFRSLMSSLRATLKEYDAEELLICNRNNYGVNTELLDCDYYRYLEGDTSPEVMFRGEYMAQYSWAEDAVAQFLDF